MLENVEVLAADQKLERLEAGKPQPVTVITLLVNPEDAQKLTLAASGGRVQLVLRNPIDTDKQRPAMVSRTTLYHLPVTPAVSELPKIKRTSMPPVLPTTKASVVETIKGDKRDTTRF